MKHITLRDIANQTGVSTNTVSLALKNSERVATETRRKILSCAQELGYVPNAAAQTLVTKRSGLIGVAMGARSEFRDGMFLGMVEQARRYAYDVVVNSQTEEPPQIVQAFQRRLTEGVVVLVGEEQAIHIGESLKDSRLPHVFILGDRPRRSISGPSVAVDNYMGAYQAVSYLIESGHRDIGYLAGSTSTPTDKTRGVHEALSEHGLSVQDAWVLNSEHSVAGGREAADALLDLPEDNRPTAVFARTDHLALGFIQGLQDAGLRVPDAMSVIGYDGIEAGHLMRPALTSMVYPALEIGARAMDALHGIINGDSSVSSLLVAPSLRGGGTVCPVKS